jgi:hypothetical protein
MRLNFFNNKYLYLCVLCELCGFENSCLFVVISYIFPLCRSLSAIAFVKADLSAVDLSKADAFVAMSQLCKTNPICWILK